jgi:hypothetical protein
MKIMPRELEHGTKMVHHFNKDYKIMETRIQEYWQYHTNSYYSNNEIMRQLLLSENIKTYENKFHAWDIICNMVKINN